jgi:hypothetical protein
LEGVGPEGSISCVYIPAKAIQSIEHPLGILSGSYLAFIDKETWVCTMELGSSLSHTEPTRYYPIPADYFGRTSLEQCWMGANGTVYCPKDDQVAVIRSRGLEQLPRRVFDRLTWA